MNNLRVMMLLCFATVFSAGIVTGKLWERSTVKALAIPQAVAQPPEVVVVKESEPVHAGPNAPETGWLRDLNLSRQQSEQMRAIWSEVMKNGPMNHEKRDALKKERDDAIKAIMSDEQRQKQTTLLAQYDAKNDEIGRRMRYEQETQRKQRDEALKALLDNEQRSKYEAAKSAYESKSEELNRELKKAFDDAVERTRQLLTPEQRVKYDEIRKKHEDPQHRHFTPDWQRDSRDGERRPTGPRPDTHNAPKQ